MDGDTATASCYLQANHFYDGAPGGNVFVVWAKYTDQFVRTGDGWKIKHRDLAAISAGGNQNLFNEAAELAGARPLLRRGRRLARSEVLREKAGDARDGRLDELGRS